jgi:hypothetical protein
MLNKFTFCFFLWFSLLFSQNSFTQEKINNKKETTTLSNDELSIYPNPTSGDKLYIVSKNNFIKHISIFNVLGKEIQSATIYGKELNIGKLKPGVYIIKITENSITATRKLIVR